MLKKVSFYVLGIVALLVIIVVLWIQLNNVKSRYEEEKQANSLLEASQDSSRKVYNEQTKEWEYHRQSFKATEAQLTEYLKAREKELYELKKKRKADVGIIVNTEAKIDTVVVNTIDTIRDTRIANITTPYYKSRIESYPDSTKLSIKMVDTLSHSIGKDGLLITTNRNPHVDIVDQKAFYVAPKQQKKKNFKYWVGAIAGGLVVYGITK